MILISDLAVKNYSYSALSQFKNCPRAFYFKYIEGHYPNESSLALSLGSLLHKAKELISLDLIAGKKPDYSAIMHMVMETGWEGQEKSSKTKTEKLDSVRVLRERYPDEWSEPDNKSGMTYDEKLHLFETHLPDEEADSVWHAIAVELPFDLALDRQTVPIVDKETGEVEERPVHIKGVIDKIEQNDLGQLRIVDYKSSKKVFEGADLKTPLQMYIYHLACQKLFPDREIVEHLYDFMLLGQTQIGGSSGWLARAEKKLNHILDSIRSSSLSGQWEPKPTPLCHWCAYCPTNENAIEFKNLCHFYSFWTPTTKTFEVAQKWSPEVERRQQQFDGFRW